MNKKYISDERNRSRCQISVYLKSEKVIEFKLVFEQKANV